MRLLLRLIMLIGCCEVLPTVRRGGSFGTWLRILLVLIAKQQVLGCLPITLGYQCFHVYAGWVLGLHLLRLHADGRPGTPGPSLLCGLGCSDHGARAWGEPLLMLGFALLTVHGRVLPGFQPFYPSSFIPWLFDPRTVVALLRWDAHTTALVAQSLPFISALTLALYHRLEPRPARHAPEARLTFVALAHIDLPRLAVPSAAWMALDLTHEERM